MPESGGKRLTPSQYNVLYVIGRTGEYRDSISQLSRDMGYESDSTVNTAINDLIRGGFVTDGPPFKVTEKGRRMLGFTRFPDYLLAVILAIGGVDIVISLEDFGGLGAINPVGTLAIGVALVIVTALFWRVKKRIYSEFLGLKRPL